MRSGGWDMQVGDAQSRPFRPGCGGRAMKSGVGICKRATHRVAPTDRAVEGKQ